MRRLTLCAATLAACLTLALFPIAPSALAQDLPTLLADSIVINPDQSLTAEGAVEVLFMGQRMTARSVTYDRATNRLKIEGPIYLDDGQGAVMLADQADLAADFREGVLTSARMVLDDQLQLAARQIDRVDGRYTQLSRVTASSCQVCASNPVPLWEIRASRVVHDQVERQLYYDNAQFRFAGVPILWLPHLRMPDPTLARARGFLLPSFRSSSTLGFGVLLPYFLPIGDSRDLTITPYVASNNAQSVALRYRQAFRTGTIELNGAWAKDEVILNDPNRGYLFGTGTFALPRGYTLGFQLETVSDDAFLLDYDYSDKDRLASGAYVTRTKRDLYFDARLYKYNSLRSGDSNQTLPTEIGDLSFARRFTPALIGGQAVLTFDLHDRVRTSDATTDANGDGIIDGRDDARASLGLDWRRSTILPNGMVVGADAALVADLISVSQDPTFPDDITRITPTVSVDLRWPWVRAASTPNAATQVIEPIAQLVYSPEDSEQVPNEDSALVEFDEGNLFSFSRFPGGDVRESGLRANLGLTYSLLDPDGWSMRLTGGRVLRSEDLGQFSTGSGLSGDKSDWLLAIQIANAEGLSLSNRMLFDDKFDFSKNELRMAWAGAGYDLAANYVWLVADPSEGRNQATSEIAFFGGWKLSDGWRMTGGARYDMLNDEAIRAGTGLEFRNECAAFDLSLSRRFTSSTTVQPTTEFGLTVRLNGFGTRADGTQFRRSCSG